MPSRPDDDDFDPRPAPPKSNAAGLTLSIVGLVIGVLALLFSFIPCVGALAFWPGIVAAVLAVIGLVTSKRAKAVPVTAVVVSLLSVGIAYWQGTRAEKVGEDLKKGGEQLEKDLKKGAEVLQKEADRLEKERKEKERLEKDKKNKTDN